MGKAFDNLTRRYEQFKKDKKEEVKTLTSKEAIRIIKSNYPPERYTMLREALDLAIRVLQEDVDFIESTKR